MNKRLIICADGTWNKPDQMDRGSMCPTNVLKLARAILPTTSDGTPQIVFYDEGVGATGNRLYKWIAGAMGLGLSKNIVDGYRFLVHNYEPGDELFLFGFSRGAFTVRSLAGLIGIYGLLPKNEVYYLPDLFSRYQKKGLRKPNEDVILKFKMKHKSRNINIKFLGVWDTVGALGLPLYWFNGFNKKYKFHDVKLGSHILNACQALAIDEKRKIFKPAIWETDANTTTKVEQHWFAGVHSNVGGGYKPDGLANIPFHWMLKKAGECGLEWDREFAEHFEPHYDSILRETHRCFYRLWRKYYRPIDEDREDNKEKSDRDRQKVAKKAIKRHEDKSMNYAPRNLIDYLNKTKHKPNVKP